MQKQFILLILTSLFSQIAVANYELRELEFICEFVSDDSIPDLSLADGNISIRKEVKDGETFYFNGKYPTKRIEDNKTLSFEMTHRNRVYIINLKKYGVIVPGDTLTGKRCYVHTREGKCHNMAPTTNIVCKYVPGKIRIVVGEHLHRQTNEVPIGMAEKLKLQAKEKCELSSNVHAREISKIYIVNAGPFSGTFISQHFECVK